jgi:hypothetical protein
VVKKKTEAPSALQLKTCKRKVRRAGKHEECGKQFLGTGRHCGGVHLLPMKTGFCSNGWCEGKKATDWRGRPVPTCSFIETCPCGCHDTLDKLFAMTESERIVVESSGYSPPHRTFWMPSDDPIPVVDESSSPNGTGGPVVLESPAPDRVPASIVRDFTPTPSGRAAKGELEWWVKHQCDIWLIDEPGEPCTPSYLAAEIARDQGITPPSVGAINAVFERWIKLGFAVIEKKPTRFVRYTEDGVKYGLEKMKSDAKRRARLQLKDDRRNLRR